MSASLSRFTELGEIQACWDPKKPLTKLPKALRQDAIQKICDEIVDKFGDFVAAGKVSPIRQKSMASQVQERLGRKYIIKDKIASGKLAIIYRAERVQPKQTVA